MRGEGEVAAGRQERERPPDSAVSVRGPSAAAGCQGRPVPGTSTGRARISPVRGPVTSRSRLATCPSACRHPTVQMNRADEQGPPVRAAEHQRERRPVLGHLDALQDRAARRDADDRAAGGAGPDRALGIHRDAVRAGSRVSMTSASPSMSTAMTCRSIQLQNHSLPSCHRGDSGIPRPLSRILGSVMTFSPSWPRRPLPLYERPCPRSTTRGRRRTPPAVRDLSRGAPRAAGQVTPAGRRRCGLPPATMNPSVEQRRSRIAGRRGQ